MSEGGHPHGIRSVRPDRKAVASATMRRIARDAVPPQPWKNGGGTTRELLVWPPDAGPDGWSLRLSLATIDHDGPFSPFPGLERHFVVVDGAGVSLAWPTGSRWVCRGDRPLVFDGADAPDARLIDGTTEDLNLMLRRVHGRGALVPALAGLPWRSDAPWRGLYAADTLTLQRAGAPAEALPAHTLCWTDADPRGTGGPGADTWCVQSALEARPADRPLGWWIDFTPFRPLPPGDSA